MKLTKEDENTKNDMIEVGEILVGMMNRISIKNRPELFFAILGAIISKTNMTHSDKLQELNRIIDFMEKK